MKIVVGLGNPGREYASTRHNVGFMVVDELSRRLGIRDSRSRFRALLSEGFDNAQKLVVVKPQTYMNLSGTSVREAVSWYKTPIEDLLVVADDIDLPFGVLRMRAKGSSGGHNGLRSIMAELNTDEVPRLRIGVGRGRGDATRQVLTRFHVEEETALPEIVDAAVECVLVWERQGIIAAMNRCNRRASTGDAFADSPSDATPEKTDETEANGDDAGRRISPFPAS